MGDLDRLAGGLRFVTLWTRDLKASRKFYVELLGFELIDEKGGEFFQVSIAGVPFCVDFHPERSGIDTNQIGIGVERLDRVIEVLDRIGVPNKKGARPGSTENWASITDPDGHELIFIAER